MSPTTRLRAAAVGLACAVGLLSGCSSGGQADGPSTPMGWNQQVDEPTGISFSLPVPITGPEETSRPGEATDVTSRAYGARVGELTISVQFLSTPDDPGALRREIPAQRAPFEVIDQIRSEGDYDAEVLSNDRVEEMDQPTYDAHLELFSADEEARWRMRTRAFEDFIMVTQVIAFGGEDLSQVEPQLETAFERLNDTVEVPDSLQ